MVRGFLQRVCRMFKQPYPSILLFDLDGTVRRGRACMPEYRRC
ncbi:hypothetical protein BH24GEM2_BH24GEM2_10440 [soil metagenome]